MKAFRFRLEAVLTLREQVEQASQRACAEAQRAVQRAAAQLQVAEDAIATSEEQRLARLRSACQANHLEQMRVYEVILRERRACRARDLADAREHAEKARVRLLAATQAREALEHLRKRQHRVYRYEQARSEQKTLDEQSARGPMLATSWREERSSL